METSEPNLTRRLSPVVRALCLGMTVVLFYTQVLGAQNFSTSFWAERQKAVQRAGRRHTAVEGPLLLAQAPMQTPGAPAVLPDVSTWQLRQPVPTFQPTLSRSRLLETLPLAYGSLQSASLRPLTRPGSQKLIIHIQDAHLNLEGQFNISKMIQTIHEGFIKEGKLNGLVVGVEGAVGAIDVRPYRGFPDPQITKDIADYCVQAGFMGGASHAAITSAQEPPRLWGIDDADRYTANVQAFKTAHAQQQTVIQTIAQLDTVVNQLKGKLYSPELSQMDRLVTRYAKGKMGLGAYVEALARMQTLPPMLARFLKAYRAEQSLNFPRVAQERETLMGQLTDRLEPKDLQTLVSASVLYRAGRIGYGEFYQRLQGMCQKAHLSLAAFPTMEAYIRYVLLADGLQAEQLFKELHATEHQTLIRFCRTPKQRELVQLSEHLALLDKLVSFTLTPEEWQRYRTLRKPLPELRGQLIQTTLQMRHSPLDIPSPLEGEGRGEGVSDRHTEPHPPLRGDLSLLGRGNRPSITGASHFDTDLVPFETFYQSAQERNEALVQNLLKVMEDTKAEVGILIAGGFHSPGISQWLEHREIAHVVLRPKISTVDSSKGSAYLNVFVREKTPLEVLFRGERLSVAPAVLEADQPLTIGVPLDPTTYRQLHVVDHTALNVHQHGTHLAPAIQAQARRLNIALDDVQETHRKTNDRSISNVRMHTNGVLVEVQVRPASHNQGSSPPKFQKDGWDHVVGQTHVKIHRNRSDTKQPWTFLWKKALLVSLAGLLFSSTVPQVPAQQPKESRGTVRGLLPIPIFIVSGLTLPVVVVLLILFFLKGFSVRRNGIPLNLAVSASAFLLLTSLESVSLAMLSGSILEKEAPGKVTLFETFLKPFSQEEIERGVATIKPTIFGGYDVRGKAIVPEGKEADLQPVHAYLVALTLGTQYLAEGTWRKKGKNQRRAPRALVTADHRLSSHDLQRGLIQGFREAGFDVWFTEGSPEQWQEYMPTGAASRRALVGDYDIVAQVSGSHNPWDDNGLKITMKQRDPATGEVIPAAVHGERLPRVYHDIKARAWMVSPLSLVTPDILWNTLLTFFVNFQGGGWTIFFMEGPVGILPFIEQMITAVLQGIGIGLVIALVLYTLLFLGVTLLFLGMGISWLWSGIRYGLAAATLLRHVSSYDSEYHSPAHASEYSFTLPLETLQKLAERGTAKGAVAIIEKLIWWESQFPRLGTLFSPGLYEIPNAIKYLGILAAMVEAFGNKGDRKSLATLESLYNFKSIIGIRPSPSIRSPVSNRNIHTSPTNFGWEMFYTHPDPVFSTNRYEELPWVRLTTDVTDTQPYPTYTGIGPYGGRRGILNVGLQFQLHKAVDAAIQRIRQRTTPPSQGTRTGLSQKPDTPSRLRAWEFLTLGNFQPPSPQEELLQVWPYLLGSVVIMALLYFFGRRIFRAIWRKVQDLFAGEWYKQHFGPEAAKFLSVLNANSSPWRPSGLITREQMRQFMPMFEERLEDHEADVRWVAAKGLVGILVDYYTVEEQLVKEMVTTFDRLRDQAKYGGVRQVIMGQLAHRRLPTLIPFFEGAFNDPNAVIKELAARGLVNAYEHQGPAALVAAVGHSNNTVREFAVRRLATSDDPLCHFALERALDDPVFAVQAAAAEVLARRYAQREGVSGLVDVLERSPSSELKRAAIALLVERREYSTLTMQALEQALDDPNETVGQESAEALLQLYAMYEPAQVDDYLRDLLRRPNPQIRGFAAQHVALNRRNDLSFLPQLEEVRNDANATVQFWAEQGLTPLYMSGNIPTHKLVDTLQRSLSRDLRRIAAERLARLRDRTLIPVFEQALNDPDEIVRSACAQTLYEFEGPAVLVHLVEHSSYSDLRRRAIQRLAGLNDPTLCGFFERGLRDQDHIVRIACARALGRIGGRETLPVLQALQGELAQTAPNTLEWLVREAVDAARAEIERRLARPTTDHRNVEQGWGFLSPLTLQGIVGIAIVLSVLGYVLYHLSRRGYAKYFGYLIQPVGDKPDAIGDGVRVHLKDGSWFLVRYSNTGKQVTLKFEAETQERLVHRIEDILNLFESQGYSQRGLTLDDLKLELDFQRKVLTAKTHILVWFPWVAGLNWSTGLRGVVIGMIAVFLLERLLARAGGLQYQAGQLWQKAKGQPRQQATPHPQFRDLLQRLDRNEVKRFTAALLADRPLDLRVETLDGHDPQKIADNFEAFLQAEMERLRTDVLKSQQPIRVPHEAVEAVRGDALLSPEAAPTSRELVLRFIADRLNVAARSGQLDNDWAHGGSPFVLGFGSKELPGYPASPAGEAKAQAFILQAMIQSGLLTSHARAALIRHPERLVVNIQRGPWFNTETLKGTLEAVSPNVITIFLYLPTVLPDTVASRDVTLLVLTETLQGLPLNLDVVRQFQQRLLDRLAHLTKA